MMRKAPCVRSTQQPSWQAPAARLRRSPLARTSKPDPPAQLVRRMVLRDHLGPRAGALCIRLLDLEPPGAGQPVACGIAVVADVKPRHRRAYRGRDTQRAYQSSRLLDRAPAIVARAPDSSGVTRKKRRVARGISGRTPLRAVRGLTAEAENGRGILWHR
jgi:hypothetical protein